MNVRVFIEPHERHEALEAYRQWLTVEQESEIEDAPDGALVCLERRDGNTVIQVIKEGRISALSVSERSR